MIPETRLQEIEEKFPQITVRGLVAEVRKLRGVLEQISMRRGEAGPNPGAVARAALTEESDQP